MSVEYHDDVRTLYCTPASINDFGYDEYQQSDVHDTLQVSLFLKKAWATICKYWQYFALAAYTIAIYVLFKKNKNTLLREGPPWIP